MLKVIDFLSVFLIPVIIMLVVAGGILSHRPVFQDFIKGAKKGFEIVISIAPTIIGLFVAVGILRESGTLDLLCDLSKPVADVLHLPVEILPVSIIKMFSSSSANGLLFDLFKKYGTDSYIGLSASILLSCTETLFYTISVYFMAVGIRKSKWVIPVGIISMVIGIFASVFIARLVLG
ncbi:MAG: spore maturation protein [Lachnospiraceae bacterium]